MIAIRKPGAFSRRIKAIEAWVGVTLVDRSKPPLALTSAGAPVSQALNTLGQEALRPRSMIGLAITVGAGIAVMPFVKRWLILRRRRFKRHPANYSTHYRTEEKTCESHLIDINCFGTKLARPKDQTLEVGDGIEIAIEESWVAGKVIWSNKHYSGVQFKRAIGLGEVTEIVANST